MAVRFNASGESLSRARLSGARTLMGWFRIVTDRNDYTAFFGAGDNRLLGTDSDGTTLLFYDGAVEFTSTNLTVGTWYHLTLTLSSDAPGGAFVAYLNGALSMNGNTSAADSGTTMYVANDAYGEWLNGNVAHVKLWSAVLTAAEVQQEMYTVAPVRTDNLFAWYPLDLHTDLADYSGAGNGWTGNGTLTTEDGPPVSWGGAFILTPAVPVSGPSSQDAAVGVAEGRTQGMAASAAPGAVTVIPGLSTASVTGYAPAAQPGTITAAVGLAVATGEGNAPTAQPGGLSVGVGTASAQTAGASVAAAPGAVVVAVGRTDVGTTAYPVEATLSDTSQSVGVGLATASAAGYAPSGAPGTLTVAVGRVDVGITAYPVEASLSSQSVAVGLAAAGIEVFEVTAAPGLLVVAVGGAQATVEGYAVDTARTLIVGVGLATAQGQGAPVIVASGASLATAGTVEATVEGYAVHPAPGGIVAQVGLAVARAEVLAIAPGELAVTGAADVSDSATNLLMLAEWLRDDVWISDSAAGSVRVENNQ